METVTITINRSNVLADMKVKSHAEVALIADPKERYLAELGTEKEQEAQQCITDAATEVRSVLRQSLLETASSSATDPYDTGAITYPLSVTARKAPGLADALAKAIHAYIVDSALDKFYTSVSRADFAERHRARTASALTVISNIIYHRANPAYTSPTSPTPTPTPTPTPSDNEDDNDNDS